MAKTSNSEVTPRNGYKLIVGIVARISGCENQKELSLDDQVDHGEEVAREHYDGKIEFRTIETKGKGERLDRPELVEVEEWLRSSEFDLLIFEDVGRLVRGVAAVNLCGIAVDHGTRVLSPNDFIDTSEGSWEEDVIEACKDHIKHNAHTSRRIKQKNMNRFKKFGGATALPIYGYIKPDGAKTYADWYRDEKTIFHIEEGKRILQRTLNGEAVAEYFNENNVPTGPYCRNKKWNGRMVLRFYRNPILKGMPQRGLKHTIKHFETGRRIAVPNPKGPTYREEPHLAFMPPDEFDALQIDLNTENSKYQRKKDKNGVDSRHRVPKKRTRSFGQHARCWYCGAHYVWGGNGITDNLMCSNSREWNCWNSVGFNGPLTAGILVKAILQKVSQLDGIDQQFQAILQDVQQGGTDGFLEREKKLLQEEGKILHEKENIKKAVKERIVSSSLLKEMVEELKEHEKRVAFERLSIERAKESALDIPSTPRQLESLLQTKLDDFAIDSFEFGGLIRELVPEMHVYLVRLCDGGHLLPRAKIRLNLIGSIKDAALVPEIEQLLTQELTLDLFEPPQRERIRSEAVQLESEGYEQREIAQNIKERPTQTAVWKALALDRKMKELGISSPYVMLEEPPVDYKKLRRYKNKKYKFTPVADYIRSNV